MKGQNYLVELLNALAVSQELMVSNVHDIKVYSRPASTSAWCEDFFEVLQTGKSEQMHKLICLQNHLLNYPSEMFVPLLAVSFTAAVNIVAFSPSNHVLKSPLGWTVGFNF